MSTQSSALWLIMEVFFCPCHKLVLILGVDKSMFNIK